jgi:hypothetical protein
MASANVGFMQVLAIFLYTLKLYLYIMVMEAPVEGS